MYIIFKQSQMVAHWGRNMQLIVKQNFELVYDGVFSSLMKSRFDLCDLWMRGWMYVGHGYLLPTSCRQVTFLYLLLCVQVFTAVQNAAPFSFYTKSTKATQNWQVAVRSCVSHRSCSVDLGESWNWRYIYIYIYIYISGGILLRP